MRSDSRTNQASFGHRRPTRAPWFGQDGHLDLKVEAQLVGRDKGGFGRTPGVEAQVIEAMGASDLQDSLPGGDVGRRMASLGEDRALQGAAQEDLAAIEAELRAVGGDLAQAEADAARLTVWQRRRDLMQRGAELVPQRGVGAERVPRLEEAILVGGDGER